jgi:micrococcal nuclease
MKPEYCYYAKVERVVDADTIDLLIDCGFSIIMKIRIRVAGIDAWEVRGPERPKGLLAKTFVENLLPVGAEVTVKTGKYKGKYGRYIGNIYCNGIDLSETLVENGHAEFVEY